MIYPVLKLLLQPFSFALIIIAFFVTIVPAAIVALPFRQQTRFKISAPFWRLFSYIVIYVATLSRVHSEDRRKKEDQKSYPQGLFISNHLSAMDIPLLLTRFQVPPIMKKEVLYIPIFGMCGYSAGAMIVDRKNPQSRKKAFEMATQRLVKGFKSLQYYPEGTRQRQTTSPKPLEKIKKPILKFAYHHNVAVYAVSVYGTQAVFNPKSALINYGNKIGIIVHDAIHPKDFSSEEEFLAKAWGLVIEGHHELEEKLS